MLAETPVTQHSSCYSAVSASLTNPFPDCSNYSPFCLSGILLPDREDFNHSVSLLREAPLARGSSALLSLITPHAQRERGKVIGRGVLVYIYICLWTKKIFESYFRDRFTF